LAFLAAFHFQNFKVTIHQQLVEFLQFLASNMDPSDDVALEIIELFVNAILYVRKVYPEVIFERRKAYNIPVRISILPPLNDYIKNVLTMARQLQKTQSLRKVELLIYTGDKEEECLESYVFQVQERDLRTIGRDEYLIEVEEGLRRGLLDLEHRVKHMKRLPARAQFKMMLHTTKHAYFDEQTNPKLQDFPFVMQSERVLIDKLTTQILPLTTTPSSGLQIYAEEYF
jgi:mitotic spindle assembly checkpoint protein MAD2B